MRNPVSHFIFLLILGFSIAISAQTETLTNSLVIEMSKTGLGEEVILNKIRHSEGNFDISANALIELKKAGVTDAIISLMMDKVNSMRQAASPPEAQSAQGYSESQPTGQTSQFNSAVVSPKEALKRAKTIALVKASLQPSRQALEKELMKRPEWKQFNLTIERYKESADLYIEIGFVPMSLITHRYVYRIYDRRSGAVIAAGETTSWGSLAENLARHICRSLNEISTASGG